MEHLGELSDASLLLHNRILATLASSSLPTDPASVIGALCEAVLRLAGQGQADRARSMLEIITAYREHITYTDALFRVVELSLARHTSLALSILKSCVRAGGAADGGRFAGLLLANAALPGVRYVLARYFGVAAEDAAGGPQSAEELLCALSAADPEAAGELIHGFLRGAADVDVGTLRSIVEAMPRAHGRNLEILSAVFALYRRAANRDAAERRAGRGTRAVPPPVRMHADASLVTPKLVELVRHEVLEASHPERRIEVFVALFSDLLLPSFMPMIAAVNGLFVAEGRYAGLLANMVKYIGVEEFVEIAKPLQIEKHYRVLRTVSNCDLETFVALYGLYEGEERAAARGCLVQCLPGFCNYCTDHASEAGRVLAIIRAHLRTHRSAACRALEQLVHSHTLNLESTLILDNPIPREMSVRILEEVRRSGVVDDLMSALLDTSNNECDRALEMVVELTGRDMSAELACAIKDPAGSPGLALHDALRLMAFFARSWVYDYDLVHELLCLRSSADTAVQKRAYFLLYALCSAHSMPCFCDMLFTDAGTCPSSARNRLLLLHALVRRGCSACKCEDMAGRFFSELVRCARTGNVKTRRAARGIVMELAGSAAFRDYLLANVDREAADQELVAGCLAAAAVLLEHVGRGGTEDGGFVGALLARVAQVGLVSEAFVGETIRIYTLVFSLGECAAFAGDAVSVVSKYIGSYHKKYNRELRDCCLAARRSGSPLSREMALHLRFRNAAAAPREIQVLKDRRD